HSSSLLLLAIQPASVLSKCQALVPAAIQIWRAARWLLMTYLVPSGNSSVMMSFANSASTSSPNSSRASSSAWSSLAARALYSDSDSTSDMNSDWERTQALIGGSLRDHFEIIARIIGGSSGAPSIAER